MQYTTQCKFCKAPLEVEVDEAYAALDDPFRLLGMAACSTCTELRVSRRTLEEKIRRTASLLQGLTSRETDERKALLNILRNLAYAYWRLIGRWTKAPRINLPEDKLKELQDNPQDWGTVISSFWATYPEVVAANPQIMLPTDGSEPKA